MSDVFSKTKRSEVMSRIRGFDNRSTERRVAAMLRAYGISGWKLRARDVEGRPDILFPRERIAVFLDGCFWHGCDECFQMPAQNRSFWEDKVAANRKRDRVVNRVLKDEGYLVIRIWEHDIENKGPQLDSLIELLKARGSPRARR